MDCSWSSYYDFNSFITTCITLYQYNSNLKIVLYVLLLLKHAKCFKIEYTMYVTYMKPEEITL